jgi:UDP-N-acetylglucosamine 4-epimerase
MPGFPENANILVTGGAGFIGSNLVEKLLKQGNQVVCLDNFSTGKHENIAEFFDYEGFSLIQGDVRNAEICRRACDGIDYVFHQAALGSVPRSINDPVTTNEVNISGFLNMLVAARDCGVRRVIYAASSSTYGDSTELPKKEDRIGRPLSPYAVTKYVNELYADAFSRCYGMELIGLRYFNVFGRRQDPCGAYAAVIPRFAIELINHRKPVINGDGSYSRDFTYIDNVLQANELAATVENPRALNTVYNVAYGDRTTLVELYEALRESLMDFDPEIGKIEAEFGGIRAGDIPHSQADISKACELLGYEPRYDIRSGLKETAEWYWTHLGGVARATCRPDG